MNGEIGIVVVTYNRLALLQEVIESLRTQTYTNYQIVVVNNGSTDETPNWLAGQKDVLTISQANLGGAGGFYTGMKYVAENDFKYCWIMDDDVICKPNALEELVRAYNVKPNIGFVCSRVSGIEGQPMNTPRVDQRSRNGSYGGYYDLIEYQMIKVQMATFVSVLLSCEIIRQEGLPYKEFFIWGDDSEYTSRISSKFDCYLACKSQVLHKRTIQKVISFENEMDEKRLNMFFYYYRNKWYNENKGCSYQYRLLFVYKKCKEAAKMYISGYRKHASILFKAAKAFLSFNPVLKYPRSK